MPVIHSENGVEIPYEDRGQGRPLLLLHGWAMSRRVWAFQYGLSDSCRIVAPDLRGHGASTFAGTFCLDDLAADVAALCRSLDLQDTVVVGWSLGAQVALKVFAAIRGRVAGMIVVGGTARFTTADDYDAGLPDREVRGLEARLKRDYARTMGEFFRRMFTPNELSREQENRIAREIVMGSSQPELSVALAGLGILRETDLRPLLPEVDCPVFLLHGDSDTICPPTAAKQMATLLPKASLALLPGAGHAPFLSQPELFNPMIRHYLQEIHGSH
jgi:pimeloyl-ACP methyl ester esterase